MNEDNKVFCSPDAQDADDEAKLLPSPIDCFTPLVFVLGPLCIL